ncbi:olfactory receptor 5P66-like [Dendropsophus ebraccatus]|uniref:olfactory receptor 5P66-like n=1 Tax=Dendropsophus ebraccatus TaxID=150705 RepID=UPI0038311133
MGPFPTVHVPGVAAIKSIFQGFLFQVQYSRGSECFSLQSMLQVNNLTVVTEFFLVGFQNSKIARIFLFCLLLVAYCGTLCGNFLIIILVSFSKILHTPMYFFLTQLSITDILLSSDIVPNTLHILLYNGAAMTFATCFTQLFFLVFSGAFECFLLTVMSYDRYVAICNPLHYNSIMTSANCVKLVVISWLFGFLTAVIDLYAVSMLTYCGQNIIDHFFCDLAPLIDIACSDTYTIELEVQILSFPVLSIPITIILISYSNIIVSILRFQSSASRRKAFSTCSSHLIVVSIFYITPLGVYVFPSGGRTLDMRKLFSLLYTVFTPFINPVIYSLKNKDINKSLRQCLVAAQKFVHPPVQTTASTELSSKGQIHKEPSKPAPSTTNLHLLPACIEKAGRDEV